MSKLLPLLTNSRASAFADCHRKHHLGYDLGYRPLEKALPLRFGTIGHYGQEGWWSESGSERLETALKYIAKACDEEEVDDFVRVAAEEVTRGYHYRWCEEQDRNIRTIKIEHQFRVPLTHPDTGERSTAWDLGGMIDKIAEVVGRGEYIVEHKFSSEDFSPGSDYQQRTILSTQISQYQRAAKDQGHTVRGCLYDVARRPTLRPGNIPLTDAEGLKIVFDQFGNRVKTKDGKKWRESASSKDGYVLQTRPEEPEEYRARLREHIAERPEEYYQRWYVVRLPEEEREAALDTWHLAQMITAAQVANAHPRTGAYNGGCKRYGSACAYLGVCTGVSSLDDTNKFRVAPEVNEELSDKPHAA